MPQFAPAIISSAGDYSTTVIGLRRIKCSGPDSKERKAKCYLTLRMRREKLFDPKRWDYCPSLSYLLFNYCQAFVVCDDGNSNVKFTTKGPEFPGPSYLHFQPLKAFFDSLTGPA